MLYIVTALKPEAQAFVEKYKLQKETLGKFKVFKNQKMMVIVSGVGVYNAMMATQTLINYFDITDDDIYLNVGICGANNSYKIGEILEISQIIYEQQNYLLNDNDKNTITCLDKEATQATFAIVDMESFGFYDAVIHSPAIKNRFMFKMVSDHFEPHRVNKDKTKALVFHALDEIFERIV